MSWSVSAGGRRDEALAQMWAQLAMQIYLPAAEEKRRDRIAETIEQFADTVPADHSLSISAWGSESVYQPTSDVEPRITQIQGSYNVSVTAPEPEPPAAA